MPLRLKIKKLRSSSLLIILTICLGACDNHKSPSHSYQVAAKGLHSAAIAQDGKSIAIGSIHHGASYWRHETKERLYNWNHKQNDQSTIISIDFSQNGKKVITAEPHTLVLWNTDSGSSERFFSAPAEILDLELGPNGDTALLGLEDHTAVIFNVKRGGIVRAFTHQNRVRTVDYSSDGRYALTGSEDYTATLWDVASGEVLVQLKHEDDVQLVKLSDDGKLALSVSKYDKALVWNSKTGEAVGEIPLRSEHIKRGILFTAARFSANKNLLLTGRVDRIVELWEIPTLKKISSWKLPKKKQWKPTASAVLDVSFLDNNRFLAVGSDGYVHELKYE